MYYMQRTFSSLSMGSVRGAGEHQTGERTAVSRKSDLQAVWATWMPLPRMNAQQFLDLADQWRKRAEWGDPGAESVAEALELVAQRRTTATHSRIHAVGQRITDFMQLS